VRHGCCILQLRSVRQTDNHSFDISFAFYRISEFRRLLHPQFNASRNIFARPGLLPVAHLQLTCLKAVRQTDNYLPTPSTSPSPSISVPPENFKPKIIYYYYHIHSKFAKSILQTDNYSFDISFTFYRVPPNFAKSILQTNSCLFDIVSFAFYRVPEFCKINNSNRRTIYHYFLFFETYIHFTFRQNLFMEHTIHTHTFLYRLLGKT